MLSAALSLLIAVPSLLFATILSTFYFHYGIDGWEDLVRELKILKFKINFLWSQRSIQRGNTNYIKIWRNSVAKHGDLVFLEKGKLSYTYSEVDELSDCVGKFLFEKGVTEKSTVGILMTNSVEFVVCWLGIIKLGARPALLNTNLRGTSLIHCLRALDDCHFLLLNPEAKRQLDKEIPIDYKLLRITPYIMDFKARDAGTGNIFGENALSVMRLISDEEHSGKWCGDRKESDAIVGYLFTSGTTGFPKAVPFAFNRLWSVLQVALIDRYSITKEDSIYSALPLYHSTALCIGLHIAVLSGCRFIIKEKFSVQSFWNDIRGHKATIFLYVGEMCRFLLNRKTTYLPKVEYETRLCIGNGMGKDIYTSFQETFKIPQIAEFYGQTECFAFLGSVLHKPGSLGYIPKIKLGPHPYRVIQCDTETMQPIRDYKTGLCKLCNMNEAGLLVVRVGNVGKRAIYHKNNKDVRFLTDVEKEGDEFINTGDMVQIGSDRSYYFVDRLGDTFRWKGENVSTQEVGACINKIPNVNETCVYGVAVPGHNGRAGMAAIVVDSEENFSFSELYTTLSENLPRYAVPIFVRMVHSLETTATYKYKTNQLKQDGYDTSVVSGNLYLVNHSEKTYEVMTDEVSEQIKKGEMKLK